MEADGDGPNDFESTQEFMDVLTDNTINWAFWNYSGDWRTSGVWTEGTTDGSWTEANLTPTGQRARETLRDR